MWWCPRAHSTGPPLDSVNLRTYWSAQPRVRLLFRVSVVWSPNVIFIRELVNSDENHSVLLHNQISQTEIFKIYLGEIMEQQKISENTAGGRISWPFGKITYVVMWNLGILYRTSILPSGTDFEKLWHTGHRQDVPEHLQRRRSSQWARCPEEGNRRARSYLHNCTPHHSGKNMQRLHVAVWMNATNSVLTKKQFWGCSLHKIQKHGKQNNLLLRNINMYGGKKNI